MAQTCVQCQYSGEVGAKYNDFARGSLSEVGECCVQIWQIPCADYYSVSAVVRDLRKQPNPLRCSVRINPRWYVLAVRRYCIGMLREPLCSGCECNRSGSSMFTLCKHSGCLHTTWSQVAAH